MAPCVSASDWVNFRGDNCAAYVSQGWCSAGIIQLSEFTGSIFGWPERACCACGRQSWLRSTAAKEASAVEHAFFSATHALDATDASLLRYYESNLRALPHVTAWLLVFAGDEQSADPVVSGLVANQRSWQEEHRLPVCIWGMADIRRVFPRVHASVQRSKQYGSLELLAREKLGAYMRFYYYFHTSLVIWNVTHGQAYPRLRYFWRLEVDVLYAGINLLAGMIDRPRGSGHEEFDLLLPDISFRTATTTMMKAWKPAGDKYYPHWHIAEGRGTLEPLPLSEAILHNVPHESHAYALVCAGRFSVNFLRLMSAKWQAGVIGYEEILLPTTCIMEPNCTVAPFGARAKIGVKHIRYRPDHPCEKFLDAYQANEGELWHPVKNRSCFVAKLQMQQQKHEEQFAGRLAGVSLVR
mgnify:CR=1 FL=1